VSQAAEPGKLKDERKWPEWEPAFVNYLSTIPGVSGVPLSYIVREKETPELGVEYDSFNEQAVACAPLVGPTFQADARKVQQLIKSFLQTETAEQWIKPIARHQSGRGDMQALRNHYSGEGNTSRRIAVAERLRDLLHYKNEKSLQFSTFLDKLQKMFNIFEEEKEEITEQAKVRMLLKKVEHPHSKMRSVPLEFALKWMASHSLNARITGPRSSRNCRITKYRERYLPLTRAVLPSVSEAADPQRLILEPSAKELRCLMVLYGPATIPIGKKCPMQINKL
jgi:hypothetical protein